MFEVFFNSPHEHSTEFPYDKYCVVAESDNRGNKCQNAFAIEFPYL